MKILVLLVHLLAYSETEETLSTEVTKSGELETTVRARKAVTAASSTTVRERDFKLRPIKRPADVLQVTPGLFVVQHAGGGKANQYFLRGYDADHGTDVALYVDGIPVNQVSHGHGQGYSDLNWLIPETVEKIEVLKGTYFPQLGDFATAGGISIISHRTLPFNQFTLTGGMFNTLRGLAMASEPVLGLQPLVAAEVYRTDGPFQNPEQTGRYSFLTKATKDYSKEAFLTLGVSGYGGDWRASGQIPEREVNAGRLDRFGSLDTSEGGNSHRYSVFGNFQKSWGETGRLKLMSYFNYYRLGLFSNFTFFSSDPVNGDQINQVDNRTTGGGDFSYRHTTDRGGVGSESTVGLQFRSDKISNALYHTAQRVRLGAVRENDVKDQSVALYANEELTWTQWFRTVVGARFDYFYFDVDDRLASSKLGTRDTNVFSPKASFIFIPIEKTDVFLNYGQGFHSNDARGIFDSANPASPLSKVYAYELGSRTRLLEDRLDLAVAGFLQFADDEIVYVGDAGGTENKGSSKRLGIEAEARVRVMDWLFVDTDINLVKPRLRSVDESADAIPYAPTRIWTGGITAQHPDGYYGRLGFFHIGDRPATEDRFLTAQGYTRFDMTLGYKQKQYEFSLAVQNIFNTKWREAQFATVSKLPGETAASCPAGTRAADDGSGNFTGCEDIHFTPGNPMNIQASATVYF